ncbi:MAG: hypothetical protein COB78_03175 [Hyphomicrobiales bacterium]|nr:MAG: hypothetical protein COB78_03175 [Hyphomicrobiales bacterium]
MKCSINFKLMSLVILAVSLISVSIVAISSYSALENMKFASRQSNEEIAQLLTKQFAGNIYFKRTDRMVKSFEEFAEDSNFHFAYGAAVRLDGTTIAENSLFDNLPELASKLGQKAITSGEQYLTLQVGSIDLVAVPAVFGKDQRIVGALVMGWDQTTNTEVAIDSAIETAMFTMGIALVSLLVLSVLLKIIVSNPISRLTSSVGDVAKHAIAGDLSKRVPEDFSDAGLMQVATSVNQLVETVDMGIKQTGDVLSAMAEADLTRRVEGDFQGAFARLKDDTNSVADHFSDIIGRLRHTSTLLRSASGGIRSSSEDLSSRTEMQAASVEETASAIEEITSTVKTSALNAEEAGRVVEKTISSAEHSGKVVGDAVEAMSLIEKSSTEIEKIIGVIDEISFQTNLLALNAGVEAARAGDAGRGFAVVAQEVRELAQRSTNAAKEIKGLIMTSGEQVKEGVRLVNETGRALETIGSDIQLVSEHVNSIVNASREQASGLQEINVAINEIDERTQKNVSMVENTNSASVILSQEVSNINNMLNVFEVTGSAKIENHQEDELVEETVLTAEVYVAPPQRVQKITPNVQSKRNPSPVHELTQKVAHAFDGNAAVNEDAWEQF